MAAEWFGIAGDGEMAETRDNFIMRKTLGRRKAGEGTNHVSIFCV
jgi:hypothetical protein